LFSRHRHNFDFNRFRFGSKNASVKPLAGFAFLASPSAARPPAQNPLPMAGGIHPAGKATANGGIAAGNNLFAPTMPHVAIFCHSICPALGDPATLLVKLLCWQAVFLSQRHCVFVHFGNLGVVRQLAIVTERMVAERPQLTGNIRVA